MKHPMEVVREVDDGAFDLDQTPRSMTICYYALEKSVRHFFSNPPSEEAITIASLEIYTAEQLSEISPLIFGARNGFVKGYKQALSDLGIKKP